MEQLISNDVNSAVCYTASKGICCWTIPTIGML